MIAIIHDHWNITSIDGLNDYNPMIIIMSRVVMQSSNVIINNTQNH